MTQLHLGIDVGATALRAAWARGGAATQRTLDGPRWPLPLPSPSSTLTFPTLKEALGTGEYLHFDNGAKRKATTHERVTEALRTVREWADPAADPGEISTVLSVPARYDSRSRTALRAAAAAAGLPRVRMLSDAMAATVAHTGGTGKSTALVLSMGYSGCETAVVRGTRGVYRTLAQESAYEPSGRALTRFLIQHAVRTLQNEGGDPSELLTDPRRSAALVKAIEHIQEKRTPAGVPRARKSRSQSEARELLSDVRLPAEYEAQLGACAKAARGRLARLLEEAGLRSSDVTELLLVGNLAQQPEVQDAVASLGLPVHKVPAGTLAVGAHLFAAHFKDGSLPDEEDPVLVSASEGLTPRSVPKQAPPHSGPLESARALAGQGRTEEARRILKELIAEAESVLSMLPAEIAQTVKPEVPVRPEPPGDDLDSLMKSAWRQLTEGRYEEAIRHAHRVHEAHRDNLAVRDALIDVHCAAAKAADRPEQYDNALRWLACAVALTRGLDPRVKEAAAARCFSHGRHLSRAGRREEAIAVLGEALDWDPEHQRSRELRDRLRGRR
ncbi:Hsp70 family protein [Streptomyces chiangmaiensis]|uniref:Hsp70 family protein n=1 Tax=Streptomyces chiangmaiensis TaxID=766497 RepID=A0ABU7FJ79_9ACTN|nr:Hsp70 family protein [Streptomyces chiangmaiensis]MED7824181.1 Hsp70 family protein [Streptomyces chiangmaiensis]